MSESGVQNSDLEDDDSIHDDYKPASSDGNNGEANDGDASSPMDGLRQRLQARIALLRKQRETDGKRGLKRGREASNGLITAEEKNKLKQQRRKAKKLKRMQQRQQNQQKKITNGSIGASSSSDLAGKRKEGNEPHNSAPVNDRDSTIASAPYVPAISDLQFSGISGLQDSEDAMRKKRLIDAALSADAKGGEKKKRMRKLIEEAEKKQRRMQELRDRGLGLGVSAEAWDTTLKRAAGDTIKDDPKVLRKAMKRMERSKQKSKARWNANTQQVKDAKDAAQEKRQKNLKLKMDRKKARRAGKSLLQETGRAGFEGQINGKLNSSSHPAVPTYSMKRGRKHRGAQ